MNEKVKDLGKLVSVHHISPASLQKAFFTAILSLIFFVATTAIFYFRQNILYFLMATGFLVVYLILMGSLIFQRRTTFSIYENGFIFKKIRANWDDINSLSPSGVITLKDRRVINLPNNLSEFDNIYEYIDKKLR